MLIWFGFYYFSILILHILWISKNVSSFLFSASVTLTSTSTWSGRIPPFSSSLPANLVNRYPKHRRLHVVERREVALHQKHEDDNDYASKGFVTTITNLVNEVVDVWSLLFIRNPSTCSPTHSATTPICDFRSKLSSSSSQELLDRIHEDYTIKNYLWTGDLDVDSNFDPSCCFTDPTLSFIGTDVYVKNIRNLRPIINLLTNVNDCRSDLLDIQSCDGYVQTRWNMIGTLTSLPWQPRVDVIGQTKFWYNNDTYKIYSYDETWEISANQALLQLITPAGTIPNSSMKKETP